jgi:hypothetical protein
MTIQDVSPDDIETFTIVTNPSRFFASSSVSGVTGSVYVFPRHSVSEKELRPLPAFFERTKNDANLSSQLNDLVMKAKGSTNIASGVLGYMTGVNAQGQSVRKFKTLEVKRVIPTDSFTSDTVRKLTMKDTLMPFYRSTSPSYSYAVTNYHSLNFFTASSVPSGSAVLFPSQTNVKLSNHASGCYMPTGALSFDFYINPRYSTDGPSGDFRAGTVFHLSSAYAVSLVTGSSKDVNGRPDGFRILLQLSHSADVAPSLAVPGLRSARKDLVFLSDDNSLQRNHWHHVVVRWGTIATEMGSGSFVIDGATRGTFCVPSASIAPDPFATSNPDVLCVGNYYEGTNTGTSAMAVFFAQNPASREGLTELLPDGGTLETPAKFAFTHPLNAEVHDLLIREGYITNDDIVSGSGKGPTDLTDALFYWPPFFTEQSPYRKFVGDHGGVLQTPYFATDGTTTDMFNLALSFGVAGHYVNLENFGRELVTGQYPRWMSLTASELNTSTSASTVNDLFYNMPEVRKRNVTVLPCDDGTFFPNYDLLTFATSSSKYVDGLGAPAPGWVTLDNLLPTSSIINAVSVDSGSIFDHLAGPSPDSFGVEPSEVLTVFQRTRDPSSNEVVMFDMSNMFYGNRILPGSFSITDTNISGTDGKVSITLRDDGNGNLYRADCFTSQSTWNSVGNVFYNEGLVLIKTPMIPFFGQDQFEVSFKGEQNIHTSRFNVVVPAQTLNSSSNPAYQLLSASLATNTEDQQFVYITGLNFHDRNLNVVMKTQLAQPVVKRVGESYMFKVRLDF